MNVTELLSNFKDPNLITSMTLSEKITASLYVTLIGMLVTFTALVILWGLTVFYSRLVRNAEERKNANQVKDVKPAPQAAAAAAPVQTEEEDEELIAVIAAAVAASMNTSIHNIVVRNIVRVGDQTPAWGRAGRAEQMHGNM